MRNDISYPLARYKMPPAREWRNGESERERREWSGKRKETLEVVTCWAK